MSVNRIFPYACLLYSLVSCAQTGSNEDMYTNELIHETSPYLLEHAHNPVNWYPWGDNALKKAREENKPLLISIGYAACHWCHVMERESFSDTAVANYMNKHFVAIKVDREERPDIDQIYIDAAQLMIGSAGWPLNVFALPDGRPFYAGTYFPHDAWLSTLERVADAYAQQHERIVGMSDEVVAGIQSQFPKDRAAESEVQMKDYKSLLASWMTTIDFQKGGFAYAPKFPLPCSWEFMLQYHYITGDRTALKAVTTTLDNMALGGIYDQVGGGFARYSTDDRWHVPHFEKMLYDNSQLVSLYADAYKLTGKPLYAETIRETLAFIRRELTSAEGGFFSSLNADSEGEEGRFYVWTKNQVDSLLGDDAAFADVYFSITASGNWEDGENILFRELDDAKFAKRNDLTAEALAEKIKRIKSVLLDARDNRIRPSTDDKILTAWNALMIKGYCDAYNALGDQAYLDAAVHCAHFLEKTVIREDGSLLRNYKDGKASIPAFLDDYAFLTRAFIQLYQTTFDHHWLEKARLMTDFVVAHFQDHKSGMFFYTSDEAESLVARAMEIPDNVIPSSNSVTAHNLFLLGTLYDNEAYLSLARTMMNNVIKEISGGRQYYAHWANLMGLMATGVYEVAITGGQSAERNRELQKKYLPTAIFLGGQSENLPLLENKVVPEKTIIYVCRNKVCKLPVTGVDKALELIGK